MCYIYLITTVNLSLTDWSIPLTTGSADLSHNNMSKIAQL